MIESLAATPERVRQLLAGVCETELSRKPAHDVFSLRENALHLRDIDVEGYEKRVERILTEEHPFLPDVDGARLARERNYNSQPLMAALDAFAASRARSMARLRNADLDRPAELEGVGAVTLRDLLARWLDHDAGHLSDIEALLAGRSGRTTADAA
jgi:DinB family protein